MFNLIYRDGAPNNTGHYEIWDTNGTTEFKVGTLVSISGGKAVAYSSGKPYGMVAIGSEDEGSDGVGDQVSVMKLTPDMIFRAKLTAGDTSALTKGGQLKVSAAGVASGVASGIAFEITEIVSDDAVEGRFVEVSA